jgi:flagellar biogenesis protein FliO
LTIVLLLIAAAAAGLALFISARRRAERAAALKALERARLAQRNRIPIVSNNVKGVTASQTIQPLRVEDAPTRDAGVESQRAP